MGIVKKTVVAILVVGFMGAGLYHSCIAVGNEVGRLGMDKDGRQILIQSLDADMAPDVTVDSEFFNHSFFARLLKEPMRTTIRFTVHSDEVPFDAQTVRESLDEPASTFLSGFEAIDLTDTVSLPTSEILARLERQGGTSLDDLLGGFGFTRYEVHKDGRLVVAVELENKGNHILLGR